MFSFSHPNVMPLIGLCLDGEIPLIIMPFMWRGTVLEYVKENRSSLYFNDSANDKEVNVRLCHYTHQRCFSIMLQYIMEQTCKNMSSYFSSL